MFALASGLLGIVVLVVAFVVGASGLWLLLRGRAHELPGVRPALVRVAGLFRLALAPLPLLSVGPATTIVEARNDWVDADGNGMLDPFVNGHYDWMDLNALDWLVMWGWLTLGIAVLCAGVLATVHIVLRRSGPGAFDGSATRSRAAAADVGAG